MPSLRARCLWVVLFLLLLNQAAVAGEYTFAVVPQHSSTKLLRSWLPVLKSIERTTGHRFKIKIEKDIPTFEGGLEAGRYDFAYMNPYHYVYFHERSGYDAIARAKDKRIHGIVVTRKDSSAQSLEDLRDEQLAFPSPRAFAASMLTRATLKQKQTPFSPKYVKSHDSVYLNVAGGHFVAGGGVVRTLNTAPDDVRDKLRILWKSPGYTPHAIARHSRVSEQVAEQVAVALARLHENSRNDELLVRLKLKGFQLANDQDWDDVRALGLDDL